jgi:hypothetical protein
MSTATVPRGPPHQARPRGWPAPVGSRVARARSIRAITAVGVPRASRPAGRTPSLCTTRVTRGRQNGSLRVVPCRAPSLELADESQETVDGSSYSSDLSRRRSRVSDHPRRAYNPRPLLLRGRLPCIHQLQIERSVAFGKEHAIGGRVAARRVSIVPAGLHSRNRSPRPSSFRPCGAIGTPAAWGTRSTARSSRWSSRSTTACGARGPGGTTSRACSSCWPRAYWLSSSCGASPSARAGLAGALTWVAHPMSTSVAEWCAEKMAVTLPLVAGAVVLLCPEDWRLTPGMQRVFRKQMRQHPP